LNWRPQRQLQFLVLTVFFITCTSLPKLHTLRYSAHAGGITSYMIATWIEARLHIDLLLHKSVDGIFINGILQSLVTVTLESDIINQFFIPFV
jgi:aspartokinase-like uncharacterized kinase